MIYVKYRFSLVTKVAFRYKPFPAYASKLRTRIDKLNDTLRFNYNNNYKNNLTLVFKNNFIHFA